MEENKDSKLFTDVDFSSERKSDETFEQYKLRRNLNEKVIKGYLKGKLAYQPTKPFNIPQTKDGKIVEDENGNVLFTDTVAILGPYVKANHGELK